ncbi:hypothetical protein RCO28_23010 [Streptomyces sp. LHD-70]|uniref:hypothetical protein n=1 Tax=Streptomyces sp. LHD-70 TaxID=3072140 RepID=UPI00280CD07D|nr:hypothetical protein [Streptomyces sp. LHD-70]MDQ8705342.1 hypothetical protein [Streptomyces sp. LHD-70]
MALALALVLVPAGGAAAAQPASKSPRGAADRSGLEARAAYFADQLRASPIYITDSAPRLMPRSAWPAFQEQAQRTGVPTYVLVLPFSAAEDGDELLPAVREKLGRKGLYVLLDADGGGSWLDVSVESYGVRGLPVQESLDSADSSLPSDATALDFFTAFVDGLLNDGDGGGGSPSSLYTSPEGRATQSTTTGVLTGLAPVVVLLIGVPLARRRGSRRRLIVPAALAAVLAVGVPLGAQGLMPETSSTGDPDPTGRDMELRAERFAAGLRQHSVYQDAELPPPLTPTQLRSVERRLGSLDVPVYVAVLPMDRVDESEGDAERFAERLQRALGKDGVYVTASVGTFGDIYLDVVNYGARLDEFELSELDSSVTIGPEDVDADPQLHTRLLRLAQHIEQTPTGPPGEPYAFAEPPTDPVAEDALPPLLTDPTGPIGLSGLFLAGVAGGAGVPAAVAGVVWLVRRARRGDGRPEPSQPGARNRSRATPSLDVTTDDSRPSTDGLRTTTDRELGSLRADLAESGALDGSEAQARAQDCLDAATLLLGRGAGAVELATGLALIRAGRAALDAARADARSVPDTTLCTLNPLHGPASMTARLSPTPGARARLHPVCGACGSTLGKVASAQRGAAVDRLRLTLPGNGRRTAYSALPGPLGEAGANGDVEVTGLIGAVREGVGAVR